MRRAPVIPEPRGIAARYRAELRAYVRALRTETETRLLGRLPSLAQERDAIRLDDWDGVVADVIDGLTVFGRRRAERIGAGLIARAEDISGWTRAQFNRSVRAVIGVDIFSGADGEGLRIALRSWARENARLITDVTEKTMTDIEGITQRGLRGGRSHGDIAGDIRKQFGLADSRAKLIARDQVSKLNGQITQQRNEALGITRYEWSTSSDERVRGSHRILNGLLCRWDDETVYSDDGGETWKSRASIGAYIGHPGQDVQCRCISSPDLTDVLAELEGFN